MLLQNDESSGIGTEKSSSPDTELNPLSASSSHEEVVPKQLEVRMPTYKTQIHRLAFIKNSVQLDGMQC